MGNWEEKFLHLIGTKNAIKSAIEAKGVTVPIGTTFRNYASLIGNIPSGGVSDLIWKRDINFYDHKGNLVAAYYLSELPLTSLPNAPTFDGLTFQEWNYTLAQVNAATYGIDVGASYISTDEKTHLYIKLTTELQVTTCFYRSTTGDINIDYGDGSDVVQLTGYLALSNTHTYAIQGWYEIKIWSTNGVYSLGNPSNNLSVFGCDSGSTVDKKLIKCHIGSNCKIATNGFYKSVFLCEISIPYNVDLTIGSSAFRYCANLPIAIVPRSVTVLPIGIFQDCGKLSVCSLPITITIGSGNSFDNCFMLGSILNLPSEMTSVYGYRYCNSLLIVVIPASVTIIKAQAFMSANNIRKYIILAETPPTLENTNAISGTINRIIYVPDNSVTAYKEATNWATYASLIYAMSEMEEYQ